MTTDPQNAAVDAEAVKWAYRLLLGREPEGEAAIEHHIQHCRTIGALRQTFLLSEEFRPNVRSPIKDTTDLWDMTPERDHPLSHGHDLANPDAARKEVDGVFYRGKTCTFWPRANDFDNGDFIETFVLKGWMPESPQIDVNARVTTFGSCFAEHVAKHLSALGYSLSSDRDPGIYVSRMTEGLVNIHSILQQFEWALENKTPPENLWYGFQAEAFGYSEEIRVRTRAAFLETDFFIVTLGLSEVWYDEATGGVLWRGVPKKHYDPARHRFRMCSVAETKQSLHRIYRMIRTHVPKAKVLFTLSPIPLIATFRPVGSVTANAASKGILRSALDEFYRENPDDLNRRLFYFPAYEIANELFPDRFEHDFRHPKQQIVEFIMQAFEAVYCEGGLSLPRLNSVYREKRRVNTHAAANGAS